MLILKSPLVAAGFEFINPAKSGSGKLYVPSYLIVSESEAYFLLPSVKFYVLLTYLSRSLNFSRNERFACRHVYQFSKVFVGEQTLSRSASASALCASSQQVATTTASFLPSHACLVSDRVMSPDVPVSNTSEITPLLLSRTPVRSPSSPSSCHESEPMMDDAGSSQVCSSQLTEKPVNSAVCSCGGLRESQVRCLQELCELWL